MNCRPDDFPPYPLITEGQRLNRETGIALGGSAESGGAVRS